MHQVINNWLRNVIIMADKFKPLNSNPRFFYGIDYWHIISQDAFEAFWNLLFSGITGKIPSNSGHIIKYCGNPECFSLIAYYPNERPSNCSRCGKKIDWE
jgi:hypothetical protein